jgi:hypothetical protein
MEKEEKKNYYPEGWLVVWFTRVKLDQERAEKFLAMRTRLCDTLGREKEACNVNNLWMRALDLLLAQENEYLEEHKDK